MPQPTRAGRPAPACCRRDGRRAGLGCRRQPPPPQALLPQAAAAVIHEAADPCKLLSLACTVDDGPGSSLDEQTAAGSLFCIENSLEACSSLEPECDEFSVYQSPDPLSLGPEGASEAGSDVCGGRGSGAEGGGVAPPPRAVLADRHLPPPPLASDPDLQEMLRQGFCAAHLLVELGGCAATPACSTSRAPAVPASLPGPAVATDRSSPSRRPAPLGPCLSTHLPAPTLPLLPAPHPPCRSVLCDTEMQLQPSCAYLEHHGPCVSPDLYLDATMRRTATSWLVEVAAEFGLHQETLFLATALLDRFLSSAKVRAWLRSGRWSAGGWAAGETASPVGGLGVLLMFVAAGVATHRVFCCAQLQPANASPAASAAPPPVQGVPRTQLQLVCVACMLVAAKHEEVRCLGWAGLCDSLLWQVARIGVWCRVRPLRWHNQQAAAGHGGWYGPAGHQCLQCAVQAVCPAPAAACCLPCGALLLKQFSRRVDCLCAGDAPISAGLHQHRRQLLPGKYWCCHLIFSRGIPTDFGVVFAQQAAAGGLQ